MVRQSSWGTEAFLLVLYNNPPGLIRLQAFQMQTILLYGIPSSFTVVCPKIKINKRTAVRSNGAAPEGQ
jgi:hypothetical protein